MGILKIMTKPDADAKYLENVVNYIMHGHSIVSGGFNICPEYALEQMQIVKNYYGKQCGNQLVHFVISFNRNVWNIAYAEKLARKIAKYYADRYQILYAVHAEPSYAESVRLYMRFREYLKKDAESDILLLDHCFAVCSNLSEWYYFHADMEDLPVPCGVYSKMRELLPCSFPCLPNAPEQEEWLEEKMLRAAERLYTVA